jgi:hypothetical protein
LDHVDKKETSMLKNRSQRNRLAAGVRRIGAGVAAAMIALANAGVAADELKKAGTVHIEQVQLAWIGSGNLGGGKLQMGGRTYEFTIGGLGIGGFGISKITAEGEVYNLDDIAYFPGAYVQGRYGFAVGEASTGELWLKNSNGVVLHLQAERRGLALSLGGDAIYINLD